jgi:transcriptional regulator with XRE-family HTH domain
MRQAELAAKADVRTVTISDIENGTNSPHPSTRQYARIVRGWVASLGLEPSAYGTHSMRRTKVAQNYKKTGNLRAVQLLLEHTKMDITLRYLGVDIEDALSLSEGIDL